MIIKVERYGGFAGITTSEQIEIKSLPSSLDTTVKELLDQPKSSRQKSPPKGAADYYTYTITIQDGNFSNTIKCNEGDIKEDTKKLIKYVEKESKKKP